jgi:ornithine cyclodeaminase/alanine dehydrogenase-like protein (mu-crystallin family)
VQYDVEVEVLRIIKAEEARALLTIEEGFRACDDAYRYYGEVGDVLSHPSSVMLPLPTELPGRVVLKPAHLKSAGVAGALLATPGKFFGWLVDFETGEPIGLVDEGWLMRRRTATTGALAAKWLAPSDAKIATIIGSGRIADELYATLTHAFSLSEVRVASRSVVNAEAFVERHTAEADVPTRAVNGFREATEDADVVVTITTAKEPFFEAGWLKRGAVLVSMGGEAEIQFDVLAEVNRFIVDDLEYALSRGDMRYWLNSGCVDDEIVSRRVDANIGEVIYGAKPGRVHPDDTVYAIIQGMSICDIAMSKAVLDNAAAAGVGQVVEL